MSSHLCMMMLFAWLSISSLFNLVQHFLVLMFGASFSIPVFFWSSIFQPQHLVSYFPALYLPPFDDLVLHFQSPRFRMVNVACKFDCGEINMSAFGFHLPVDFFMPAQLLSQLSNNFFSLAFSVSATLYLYTFILLTSYQPSNVN